MLKQGKTEGRPSGERKKKFGKRASATKPEWRSFELSIVAILKNFSLRRNQNYDFLHGTRLFDH